MFIELSAEGIARSAVIAFTPGKTKSNLSTQAKSNFQAALGVLSRLFISLKYLGIMKLLNSVSLHRCRVLGTKFSANSTRLSRPQRLVKSTEQRFFLSRPGLSASASTTCVGARASPNTNNRAELIPIVRAHLEQLHMVCASATLRSCLLRYAS